MPWRHDREVVLNPDLMRAIDYWVGIPLVFFLTIVSRIQRLVGLAASPAGRPRNILLIQLAEMGTMVVAAPSLRKARELYPDAALHFLCFARDSVERGDARVIAAREHPHRSTRIRGWSSCATRCVSLARAGVPHRHGDQPGSLRQVQQHAELLSGAGPRVGFHRFNQEGLYTGDLLRTK